VTRLARILIIRPLARDLLRTVLTIASVALGVAVVLAIDLAGDAAAGSFRSSLETLTGTTDFEVLANGKIDEKWIGVLAGLPFNARYDPVIETQASIPAIGSVTVYGVDPFSAAPSQSGPRLDYSGDPDSAAVLSAGLAARLRLHPGDPVRMVLNSAPRTFRLAGTAPGNDAEFVILDIAAAQRFLAEYGKLDRIEIKVLPGENPEAVERAVRSALPPSYLLERPGARSRENQRMLRAFRWNLRVLSYISLVVGAFLIYNTISVSVVRRRPEIGILRALGTSRAAIFWMFLGEAMLFGLAGSVIGIVLGRVLASGIVGLIGDTVNSLYASSRPAPVEVTPWTIFAGLFAGSFVAVASAFAPAREATRVPPTEAMGRGAHEYHARVHWKRDLGMGAVVAALALLASAAGPFRGYPLGGYVSALLAIGAAALCAPALVLFVNVRTRGLVRKVFHAEGLLAGRSLAGSLGRTSVVVGALATAIAMMASVAIMVGSFRETVLVWLSNQLRADLYVRPAGRSGAGQFPPLPPGALPAISSVPGIAALDVFYGLEFRYHGDRAALGAGDTEIVRRYGGLRFLSGDRDAILESLRGRDRAIVSEPFANRNGVRTGDRLDLPIGDCIVRVTVAGIYYEYSSDRGYVILDRSVLLKYLPNQPPTNAAIYLKKGVDAVAVRRELQKRTAGLGLAIAPNQSLRSQALVIFDRTFAITWALEAVAIIVAMLGAANSLLALVLDRRRELGLLRYLGASASQIRHMILLEAGFIGLLAAMLGVALGFVLSLLLIYKVNKQSFGWTIQFHPPLELLAGALLLVWCATVLAAVYPARVASRLNPIDVIHEE
jgi:putative ABC transport system permease protein